MKKTDRITEETALKNIMEGFIHSYAERDKSVGFSNWLTNRLQQEMPDMSADMSEKLGAEIIEAVAKYDQTLNDLNKAAESGQSKEEWLADRMIEACADMPDGAAGCKLQQVCSDLNTANTEIMRVMEDTSWDEGAVVEADEVIEWNEYSLKDKALNIGRQAIFSGLIVAADSIKANLETGEISDAGEVVRLALQDGLETTKDEVKAVVAGAIKTAAEQGLTEILPAGASVEAIGDIAGVTVETADALFNAATGKITIMEALEKAGRASVAAACRLGANVLKGTLARVPLAGPFIVRFAGGLLDHMKSPKFSENVYTVVRDTAVAAWEGIKQTGRGIWNQLRETVRQSLYN
jgi:hypothetical protein